MRTSPTGYQLELTEAMRRGESQGEQCSVLRWIVGRIAEAAG